MAEQVGDRFPIVSSSDGFGKDHGDVDHLYFGAMLHLILLRYGIGDYYCFKACTVDVSNGRARKDSMSQDHINSGGSSWEKFVSCMADCITRVSHVIHRIATQSFTYPTSTIRSTSLAFFGSLWIKAKSTFSLSATEVTLLAPPASGETIVPFLHSEIFSFIHFRTAGSAYKLSTGISKKPWIWEALVHRDDMICTRYRQRIYKFGGDCSSALILLILRAQGKHGMTAVTRLVGAILQALIMIKSSIRLSLISPQPLCNMWTSPHTLAYFHAGLPGCWIS